MRYKTFISFFLSILLIFQNVIYAMDKKEELEIPLLSVRQQSGVLLRMASSGGIEMRDMEQVEASPDDQESPLSPLLSSFLDTHDLKKTDLEVRGISFTALDILANVEEKKPKMRWAFINHWIESTCIWPFTREKKINPQQETNNRHFVQGHGIWLQDLSVLRKTYAVNGFRQGFEFILHRGIQLGFLALTAAQLASTTSFTDFFSKIWHGDAEDLTALAYATSRTQQLKGLYALLGLPFVWGGVKASIFASAAYKNPHAFFNENIGELQKVISPPKYTWWHDGLRWILPLHSLDQKLNHLGRFLKWDGRLTSEEQERGFNTLVDLFHSRGGYTRIVTAYHLAQLADSPSLREQNLLRNHEREDVLQLLRMKANAVEEIRSLATFPKEEWKRSSIVQKTMLLSYFTYGRYLQWWLGLAPTKKEEAAFWVFKLGKTAFSLTIINSIIQAIINYASCPKKQGVSFTGTAPWASDYSETCFDAMMENYNFIPGQPPETFTSLFSQFNLSNFGNTLDFSNKNLNGTQIGGLLLGFAQYQPAVTRGITTLNFTGNALNTAADFDALFPVLGLPQFSSVTRLDFSNNGIDSVSDNGKTLTTLGNYMR